jgi:hypothetical protein
MPSLSDNDNGKIPIEYVLVILLFGGREIYTAFNQDQISQLAHLTGGACGVIFGLVYSGFGRGNLKGGGDVVEQK